MSDMQDICYATPVKGHLAPQWVGTHKLRTTGSPRCLLGPWLRLAESELAVQRNEVLACPGDSRGSLVLLLRHEGETDFMASLLLLRRMLRKNHE